jgi:hypothetical protein
MLIVYSMGWIFYLFEFSGEKWRAGWAPTSPLSLTASGMFWWSTEIYLIFFFFFFK